MKVTCKEKDQLCPITYLIESNGLKLRLLRIKDDNPRIL
jgi:hypothetical protein